MYLGDRKVGFFGLANGVLFWAPAPFGVQAEAVELGLSGADGGEGVGVTGTVASTFAKGRILPLNGRRISADSAVFSGLGPA